MIPYSNRILQRKVDISISSIQSGKEAAWFRISDCNAREKRAQDTFVEAS